VTGSPLGKTTTLSIAVTAQQGPAAQTTYTDVMRDIFVPFCLQCHSSTLSGAARNAAPVGVDFNTFANATFNDNEVRANVRIQAGTMPPTGGLPGNLRALMQDWAADRFLPNQPPIAKAGPDQLRPAGSLVTLDGLNITDPSTDPEGTTIDLCLASGLWSVSDLIGPSGGTAYIDRAQRRLVWCYLGVRIDSHR
jgi:hypothetical protein